MGWLSVNWIVHIHFHCFSAVMCSDLGWWATLCSVSQVYILIILALKQRNLICAIQIKLNQPISSTWKTHRSVGRVIFVNTVSQLVFCFRRYWLSASTFCHLWPSLSLCMCVCVCMCVFVCIQPSIDTAGKSWGGWSSWGKSLLTSATSTVGKWLWQSNSEESILIFGQYKTQCVNVSLRSEPELRAWEGGWGPADAAGLLMWRGGGGRRSLRGGEQTGGTHSTFHLHHSAQQRSALQHHQCHAKHCESVASSLLCHSVNLSTISSLTSLIHAVSLCLNLSTISSLTSVIYAVQKLLQCNLVDFP